MKIEFTFKMKNLLTPDYPPHFKAEEEEVPPKNWVEKVWRAIM
jgi:hypothetical protein